MNTATHTPKLPLRQNGSRILDADSRELAACTRSDPALRAHTYSSAGFIVDRCNAHDDLVAALKFAKESIVQNRTLDEARNDRALNETMVAIENRISDALAKAGA